jgi:uncharacterized protein HemY
MSAIEILRNEAKQYIDEADEKAIKMVIAMLEVNAEEDEDNEDADWWKNMPDDIKAEVEESIKESEEGKGIPHEEAMKMIKERINAL